MDKEENKKEKLKIKTIIEHFQIEECVGYVNEDGEIYIKPMEHSRYHTKDQLINAIKGNHRKEIVDGWIDLYDQAYEWCSKRHYCNILKDN